MQVGHTRFSDPHIRSFDHLHALHRPPATRPVVAWATFTPLVQRLRAHVLPIHLHDVIGAFARSQRLEIASICRSHNDRLTVEHGALDRQVTGTAPEAGNARKAHAAAVSHPAAHCGAQLVRRAVSISIVAFIGSATPCKGIEPPRRRGRRARLRSGFLAAASGKDRRGGCKQQNRGHDQCRARAGNEGVAWPEQRPEQGDPDNAAGLSGRIEDAGGDA